MRIGSDHNLHIFFKKKYLIFKKTFKRLQAVRSVASGGKFYRLPPDKENTGFVVIFGINTTSDISKLSYEISRAVRRVKFETILKYLEWYLRQISHCKSCYYLFILLPTKGL